jgi:hypothetical protein
MRTLYLLFFISTLLITGCSGSGFSSDEEEYADGTYCAYVTYSNPNLGTENTYTLEVDVSSNAVTKIHWNNGGWLDEDHFTSDVLDEQGKCSFTSDRGYDYAIEIIGKNCSQLDSEDMYKKRNLPMYSFEEAVTMTGMTQEEINDLNIYSEGDVLSENDMFILKREIQSIRKYLNAMNGYNKGYEQEIDQINKSQSNLKKEIDNGYVQRIERKSIYGTTNQTVTISKKGINYLFEVRGADVTMGTAQFDENETGWQMVYIKQNPNVEKYSGYSMRIIDSGF